MAVISELQRIATNFGLDHNDEPNAGMREARNLLVTALEWLRETELYSSQELDAWAVRVAALSQQPVEGVFGRDDLPNVMVYTAKILKDMSHHDWSFESYQMVMFGDHQRALDKVKAASVAQAAGEES